MEWKPEREIVVIKREMEEKRDTEGGRMESEIDRQGEKEERKIVMRKS
jgi:hypothetical protein